ncbi:retrotransposon protein, putative, ty1-copia subclass [Tanacetum coccineum]|uniref:Retrotransposon protein, putative, ty1-copia subclass n=1 Tax=Tanacetum coccineum TaxID=301880 RepID=A0ABQ4Z9F8_9ASTR
MDGKVHTYKARLVAKGYTQTYGIDYEETFSLMDVKTAFLNGTLTKDVFKAQSEGFENAKYPKRVCKVKRPFMDLNMLLIAGISASMRKSHIIGNDIPMLQSVKDWLGKCFAMKDLGDATYILGIKIYRDMSKHLIGLSQDTYLDKILKRFKMENSKKGNLPRHHGIKISKDLCPKTDKELDKISRVPYASAIKLIMYAMTCTRPDVSIALNMVSPHQQKLGEGQWTAVNNIRKYLGNTKERGAVTWKSSKQDTVADSICKSEYIAACEASKEAI